MGIRVKGSESKDEMGGGGVCLKIVYVSKGRFLWAAAERLFQIRKNQMITGWAGWIRKKYKQ